MTDSTQEHPEKDQLLAFGMGKLEPYEAERIAQHLDRCHDCSETIVNLQDDTFVSLVRNSPAPAPVGRSEIEAGEGQQARHDVTVDVASGLTGDDEGPPAELPPELCDHPRYEILELIGRGGMGDVYKAQHKMMNRVVALKVIKPKLIENDAAVVRFQREVQAAARLHHRNIVTAFDAEQTGDLHYLVMQFVDGVNLDEVIRDRVSLPVDEACKYIRQAAEGLQHAHEHGMVHRDIKPHNLMLSTAGEVKILDFGLANLANEIAPEDLEEKNGSEASEQQGHSIGRQASATRQLTQLGTMMGTPDYIAPEQAEDAHTADIRSDIYSLGCTFYTLLAGQAPFDEGSVIDKIKAHTEQDAPPVSEFRDDVSVQVESILQKMMAKNPDERSKRLPTSPRL